MVSLLLAVVLGSSIGHADPLPAERSLSSEGDLLSSEEGDTLPFGEEYVPGEVISDRLGVIVHSNGPSGAGEPGTCTFEIVTLNRRPGDKISFDLVMMNVGRGTRAGGALGGVRGEPFALDEQSKIFVGEQSQSFMTRSPYSTVMLGVVVRGEVAFQIDIEGISQPMFTVANVDKRRGRCKINVINLKQ